jgi:hypothetical protein
VDWRAWQVFLLWCGRTTSAQLLAAPACSSRLISDRTRRSGPDRVDGADTTSNISCEGLVPEAVCERVDIDLGSPGSIGLIS